MYTVTLDDELIHSPSWEDGRYLIHDGVVVKKVNCADSFTFSINTSNLAYSSIRLFQSTIKVYKDDACIFSGRPISQEIDFYNTKTFLCEGSLAFLNDTIIRPYSYSGTVRGYLQMILDQHNAQVGTDKQFTLGSWMVPDPDAIIRYTSEYKTTWTELLEKTVNSSLGGYLIIKDSAGRVLDYVPSSTYRCDQEIETGKNIIDFNEVINPESYATAIIPLGATDETTGERLTIEDLTLDNKDYIVGQAASVVGLIYTTMVWDDVTDVNELYSLGVKALQGLASLPRSIKITAIDLSFMDPNVDELGFFERVKVKDPVHNVSGTYLITERKYNISAPEKDTIVLNTEA